MELQEFRATIGRLTLYFDRKPASDAAILQWYEKAKHIPSIAIKHIFDCITNGEKMPFNIGAAFRDGWDNYKSSNPKSIIRETEYCDQCSGKGLLFAKKFERDIGRKVQYVFSCGSCRNYLKHFSENSNVQRWTKENLKKFGYELENELPEIVRQNREVRS